MPQLNLHFAWCWMLAGLLVGAALGTRFHREDWLGGYGSWPRRLMRLGHVAFLGTGLLNLGLGLTAVALELEGPALRWASVLLVVGAVAMPANCFLAAWRKPFRHLFFVPVLSLIGGVSAIVILLLGNSSHGG